MTECPAEVPIPRASIGRPVFWVPHPGGVRCVCVPGSCDLCVPGISCTMCACLGAAAPNSRHHVLENLFLRTMGVVIVLHIYIYPPTPSGVGIAILDGDGE